VIASVEPRLRRCVCQYIERHEGRPPTAVPGKGVTAMEQTRLWWLVLLVALLGGVGMALGV
jgi:hypothetical protein